jgi:hypothetical protein
VAVTIFVKQLHLLLVGEVGEVGGVDLREPLDRPTGPDALVA